jgi:hypothetical protein
MRDALQCPTMKADLPEMNLGGAPAEMICTGPRRR